MKRAVEVITALVKVVYKHFPSSKRAALAASFGLCVATGLLPVSERSIKKAMTLMTDMRGAYASSFAFITTDPLDEQTLKRLEATFLAAVGRKPGVARLLEPVKPPAARKSGTGEGKGPKAAAAASGRTEGNKGEFDDEEVDVAVASLLSLLEPFMVVVLGGIVLVIVLALFLPLVSMIESVSGTTKK